MATKLQRVSISCTPEQIELFENIRHAQRKPSLASVVLSLALRAAGEQSEFKADDNGVLRLKQEDETGWAF